MAKPKLKTRIAKYIRTVQRNEVRKSDTLFWSDPVHALTINQYLKLEKIMKKWHIGGAFVALIVMQIALPAFIFIIVELVFSIAANEITLASNLVWLAFWGILSLFTLYYIPLNATGIAWSIKNLNSSTLNQK